MNNSATRALITSSPRHPRPFATPSAAAAWRSLINVAFSVRWKYYPLSKYTSNSDFLFPWHSLYTHLFVSCQRASTTPRWGRKWREGRREIEVCWERGGVGYFSRSDKGMRWQETDRLRIIHALSLSLILRHNALRQDMYFFLYLILITLNTFCYKKKSQLHFTMIKTPYDYKYEKKRIKTI